MRILRSFTENRKNWATMGKAAIVFHDDLPCLLIRERRDLADFVLSCVLGVVLAVLAMSLLPIPLHMIRMADGWILTVLHILLASVLTVEGEGKRGQEPFLIARAFV